MKKCNVCGVDLADEDCFCTNCGSPVGETSPSAPAEPDTGDTTVLEQPPVDTTALEQPPVDNPDSETVLETPKKKSKLLLLIPIVGVVAIVALVAVLVTTAFAGGPVSKVANAFAKTFESVSQNDTSEMLTKIMEQGSVEIKGDLSKWDIGAELNGSFNLKIYSNSKEQMGACDFSMTMAETTIDGGVYYTGDEMAIKSSALLGENKVYGVSLKSALENLPKSVFAPGKSEFSMDQESYDQFMNYLESIKKSKELDKEMEKVLNRYIGYLEDLLEENAVIKKASGSVSVGDKEIKTNDITIRIDEKAVSEVLKGLWAKAEKDDELKDVLARYLDNNYGLSGIIQDSTQEGIPVHGYENKTGKELVDDLWDEIDDNIDVTIDEIEGTDTVVECKFQIGSRSKTMVAFNLKVETEGETEIEIDATLGEDICTSELVELEITDANGKETAIKYTVSENNDQEYDAKLTVEGQETLTINLDKEDNSYKVSFGEDGEIRGTFKQDGETITLTVNQIPMAETVWDDDVGDFVVVSNLHDVDLQIVFKSNDTFTMPEYTEVLTMSEGEVKAMIEQVQQNVGELGLGGMGTIPPGGWEDDGSDW